MLISSNMTEITLSQDVLLCNPTRPSSGDDENKEEKDWKVN